MSKKNKLKKTLVEKMLEKDNIPFTPVKIDILNAGSNNKKQMLKQASIPRESLIYKTLASSGNETGLVVAVLPITKRLNEKKLAFLSKNKKTEMLPLKKLQKMTGYIHGANNPVGIWHKKQGKVSIFFDEQALEDKKIYLSAGKVGRSDLVDARKVANLIGATFGNLSV